MQRWPIDGHGVLDWRMTEAEEIVSSNSTKKLRQWPGRVFVIAACTTWGKQEKGKGEGRERTLHLIWGLHISVI